MPIRAQISTEKGSIGWASPLHRVVLRLGSRNETLNRATMTGRVTCGRYFRQDFLNLAWMGANDNQL